MVGWNFVSLFNKLIHVFSYHCPRGRKYRQYIVSIPLALFQCCIVKSFGLKFLKVTQYLFAHKFTMCFCKRHLALTIQGTCCKDKFQGHVFLNVEACRKSQSKLIRHMTEGQLVFFNLLIMSRTKHVTICNRISSIDPGRHRSMEREVLTFKEYLNQPSSTKNARDLVIKPNIVLRSSKHVTISNRIS